MRPTRRNFVILYRAHEGSSALIERLSAHPEISIPVFEDLDNYVVAARQPDMQVEALLDGLFATGDLDLAYAHAAGSGAQVLRPTRSIGFKWRIWGDAAAVAAQLHRHRVVVFHLFRRNAIEAAVSRHFNDVVVPSIAEAREVGLVGGSNQFAFMMLPTETQTELKARLRREAFAVPVDAVIAFLDGVIETKAHEERSYRPVLEAAGVPGFAVFYEDFACGDDRLTTAIAAAVGCAPTFYRSKAAAEPLAFKRVSSRSILRQVTNLAAIEADPQVRERIAALEAIIACYRPLIADGVETVRIGGLRRGGA